MDVRARRRAGRWSMGAASWLAGLWAASLYLGRYPLDVVAQAVIEASPGAVATLAIERLGHLAQPLLLAAIAAAVLVGAGLAGFVTTRRRYRPPEPWVGLLALGGLTLLLLLAGQPYAIPTVLLALGVVMVPPVLTAWLLGLPLPAPVDGRRRLLRGVGYVGGAALGGGALGATLGAVLPDPGGAERASEPLEKKRTTGRTIPGTTSGGGDGGADGDGLPTGFDFGEMPRRVQEIADHYVVDKNTTDPLVDSETWRLEVRGDVADPYAMTLDDLLEDEACERRVVTTECISNGIGGPLISTAEWNVIPLATLLERATVENEDVYDVVTHAVDGYTESIPIEVVRGGDVYVAVGASGETLPVAHGFPARLLVVGRYGMKSTKWLSAISTSERDYAGYWQQRGWVEEAVVNTHSYVRGSAVAGDRAVVGGVAYAGLRGIEEVEVSVDGGESWAAATLEEPPDEYAWRRWRHAFDAPADGDSRRVGTRAVDGTGTRQTEERSGPHPGGATGYHYVTLEF